MTQEELEAGANAVRALAKKYGVELFLTPDQAREISAEVIKAFLSVQGKS